MKKRPQKSVRGSADTKGENILVRVSVSEKEGFKRAASLAGQVLSVWVRDRLRQAAKQELEAGRRPVPFLPDRRTPL